MELGDKRDLFLEDFLVYGVVILIVIILGILGGVADKFKWKKLSKFFENILDWLQDNLHFG